MQLSFITLLLGFEC